MGAPAPSAEDEKAKIEFELRGKTLKVYLYVLKQGKPVGVREVQRELGFSSPSVAYCPGLKDSGCSGWTRMDHKSSA